MNQKVLVVDDNLAMSWLLRRELTKLGCDVDCVESGFAALEKVEQHSYSIILMDICLPQLDGYQTTRAIRKFEVKHGKKPALIVGFSTLPVLVMCSDAGMNTFFTKPENKKQLDNIINKLSELTFDDALVGG